VILDTDILIWYFRGDATARRFLARLPFPERAVSALTVMELVQGCGRRADRGHGPRSARRLATANVRHYRLIVGLSLVRFRPGSAGD
jgi:predicted nucleic acid-binding protein